MSILSRVRRLESLRGTNEIEWEDYVEAEQRNNARQGNKVRPIVREALERAGEPVNEQSGELVGLPGLFTERTIKYNEAWLEGDTPEQESKDAETVKRPVRRRTPSEWRPAPEWWPQDNIDTIDTPDTVHILLSARLVLS